MTMQVPLAIPYFRNGFAAYLVYQQTGEKVYAGVTSYETLLAMPDGMQNEMFRSICKSGTPLVIGLYGLHGSRDEAVKQQALLIQHFGPYCNLHGKTRERAGSSRVRCVNDGREFPNAAAAAREYGISGGNLSNHLNGKPGAISVAGRVFERCT